MIFPEEREIPHINGFFIGPNQRPLIQGSLSLIRRTAVPLSHDFTINERILWWNDKDHKATLR